jgi:hypothetical protein
MLGAVRTFRGLGGRHDRDGDGGHGADTTGTATGDNGAVPVSSWAGEAGFRNLEPPGAGGRARKVAL